MTLNRNPQNYFAEIEQMAVAPSHLVPGIEPTADPMLQARLFSYNDSQRHRLGVNYQQLPVNAPLHAYAPFQRDGPAVLNGTYGSDLNYPSLLKPNDYKPVDVNIGHEEWVGKATYDLQDVTDEDFVQAKGLWDVLARTPGQQENLVHNVATHLFGAVTEVRQRTYSMFSRVDTNLGRQIKEATEEQVILVQGRGEKDEKLKELAARLVSV
jgi:catalase